MLRGGAAAAAHNLQIVKITVRFHLPGKFLGADGVVTCYAVRQTGVELYYHGLFEEWRQSADDGIHLPW